MKKTLFALAAYAAGLCFAQDKPSAAALPTPWKAGAASVVITPETNLWMAGYAGRKKPAEGKVQDLFAKAIALQDEEGQKLVIVTMDLIGVPQELRHHLADRVMAAFGIPAELLLMNASHTHSGPELRMTPPAENDAEDPKSKGIYEFTQGLEEKLFHVIGDALDHFRFKLTQRRMDDGKEK